MKNKCEILAPAGTSESVLAAVRCGADAVYLGAKNFNARRNAENFSFEELKETIEYCHARGVRVHITLNTLIGDDEIEAATDFIEHICELGADVLILQDIGLRSLVRKVAPDIECHASTQMSVQTCAGVDLLGRLGFSTVVLPRELTKSEIESIRKSTPLRIEVFVHGALCMCVSGQCYLSSMLGSRSGNRGLCAQPCRLAFSARGGTGHDLSLKDLSLVKKIGELCDIGVDSLKIEGRMKRPEYVAAAVTAVNASLSNKENAEIENSLGAVFSRSGFTDGYFENRRGIDMFGTRTHGDVTAASAKVLSSLQRLYDKELPRIPVDFVLNVCKGEKVSLCASAKGKTCFVFEDHIPEKALNKPSTAEGLSERLSKCGGTCFYAQKIDIELDEGLIVPASVINSLRRKALDELEAKLSAVKPHSFTHCSVAISRHKCTDKPKLHVRVADISQIPKDISDVENLYIPLETEEKYIEKLQNSGVNVILEIPRGIFGTENRISKLLERAKKMGIKGAYCGTLDAVALAKSAGLEIHGGFSLNVFNSLSLLEFERIGVKSLTLSPELTLEQISKIGGSLQRGLIAYGRLPLMLTRNCPIKNGTTCDKCRSKGYLTDRMGIKFPVTCSNGCSEVLNSRPIYMADRLEEIKNADFITLYFTKESASAVGGIIEAYRKGRAAYGDFTRGLYYRAVK